MTTFVRAYGYFYTYFYYAGGSAGVESSRRT